MGKPRNPTRSLPIPDRERIDRDYSLTEQQDYAININPYVKEGYVVQPLGEHLNGSFIVMGWKVSSDVWGSR